MATPNYDFGSVLSLKRMAVLEREEEGKETRRRIGEKLEKGTK
jgi:hypothetical protein